MTATTFKLVLFDIDGTLIYHLPHWNWEGQYVYGMEKVFGYRKPFKATDYNGTVERFMPWDLVKKVGMTRQDYLKKFPRYVEVMYDHILARERKQGKVFERIEGAVTLARALHNQGKVTLGILTGNAKKIAQWKLNHTGLSKYFTFGLYGDESDDRLELAGQVFERAKKELDITLTPDEIVVIGDTIYDIRSGKAIEAFTIAVTTGMHADPGVLAGEQPDMLVDSLTDPAVLSLFSLK